MVAQPLFSTLAFLILQSLELLNPLVVSQAAIVGKRQHNRFDDLLRFALTREDGIAPEQHRALRDAGLARRVPETLMRSPAVTRILSGTRS